MQAIKINQSNKDFILFNHSNGKLTEFCLTDDYNRFKNDYQTFRVISCIKTSVNSIEI